MKPKSFWCLIPAVVLLVVGIAYSQTTRDSLYVRTLGSYPSGQSAALKCYKNGGHTYAVAGFGEGIHIIDIDSVYFPSKAGYLTLYNSRVISDICIQGSYAYVCGENGLWVIDLSDSYNPVIKGRCPLPTISGIVRANAKYAFVGVPFFGTGMHIVDIADPEKPFLVTTYDTRTCEGIAVLDSLVCASFSYRLHILDATDPMDIKVVYVDSVTPISPGLEIQGNYLYSNANNIYDISDPAHPVHYSTTGIGGWKNVLKDSVLYGANDFYLEINKLTGPVDIEHIGTFSMPGYLGQPDVIDDKLCLSSCLSLKYNGVLLHDASDPFVLQYASCVPNMFDGAACVRNDTVVSCWKGLEIYNAADTNKPNLIAFLYDSTLSFSRVVWESDYIYAAEPEKDIRVFDFSSRESLALAGLLPVSENIHALAAKDDKLLYGTGTAVHLVDIATPENPTPRGTAYFTEYIRDIRINNNLAYVADGSNGLYIYNIANMDSLVELGHCETAGCAEEIALSDGRIFVADGDSGLAIIDVADSANPQLIGRYGTHGYATYVAADSNIVFLVDCAYEVEDSSDTVGLKILDVNDPANPVLLGYYYLGYYEPGLCCWYSRIDGIGLGRDRIYGITSQFGLQIFEYYGPNGVTINKPSDGTISRFGFFSITPNPAVDNMSFSYAINSSGIYELALFNVLGQKVAVIEKVYKQPGSYKHTWKFRDGAGNKISPGVYFCRLSSEDGYKSITKKTVILK
jgi:hypothetical protein